MKNESFTTFWFEGSRNSGTLNSNSVTLGGIVQLLKNFWYCSVVLPASYFGTKFLGFRLILNNFLSIFSDDLEKTLNFQQFSHCTEIFWLAVTFRLKKVNNYNGLTNHWFDDCSEGGQLSSYPIKPFWRQLTLRQIFWYGTVFWPKIIKDIRGHFRNYGQHPKDTKKGTFHYRKLKRAPLIWPTHMFMASLQLFW